MKYPEHGITFTRAKNILQNESKHTFADWGLVPTSRPVVQMPPDATPRVQIGGALYTPERRLTGVNDGKPVYGMREGTWEFRPRRGKKWINNFSEIANFLQGRTLTVKIDDEISYYYRGTVSVDEWLSEPDHSTIVLSYRLEPYKYDVQNSMEPWLWDPFSFIDGVIRNYSSLEVDGTTGYTIIGSPMPVIPAFFVNSDGNGISVSDIYSPGSSYDLWAMVGDERVEGMRTDLQPGDWTTDDGVVYDNLTGAFIVESFELTNNLTLSFSGHGTVSILFRGGRL